MERAIEIFAAINFLVIGLSHVVQHRAWAEFFERLHAQGSTGAFANGFLSLITGSLIVAFHNVWSWPGLVLTAIGWAMVVKAGVAFVRPDLGLNSMSRATTESSRKFVIVGALMVGVAGLLGYEVWASA